MERLVTRLSECFNKDEAEQVEAVRGALAELQVSPNDWRPFAHFDEHRYTRNLVDRGDGRFNVMILCWGAGMQSSIHDHSHCNCWVKVLQGELVEAVYDQPTVHDEQMVAREKKRLTAGAVTYINDTMGLHRMGNPSASTSAVTLHVYSPPFDHCHAFDKQSGTAHTVRMSFWSEGGMRMPPRNSVHARSSESVDSLV